MRSLEASLIMSIISPYILYFISQISRKKPPKFLISKKSRMPYFKIVIAHFSMTRLDILVANAIAKPCSPAKFMSSMLI